MFPLLVWQVEPAGHVRPIPSVVEVSVAVANVELRRRPAVQGVVRRVRAGAEDLAAGRGVPEVRVVRLVVGRAGASERCAVGDDPVSGRQAARGDRPLHDPDVRCPRWRPRAFGQRRDAGALAGVVVVARRLMLARHFVGK